MKVFDEAVTAAVSQTSPLSCVVWGVPTREEALSLSLIPSGAAAPIPVSAEDHTLRRHTHAGRKHTRNRTRMQRAKQCPA